MLPTFRGTAEPGSTVTISADGSQLGSTVTDANGSWLFTVPNPLTEASYEVSVSTLGTTPARFSLTNSLDIGDVAPTNLDGLQLTDDRITFFLFGNDLDGIVESDDVILAADNVRLALPLNGLAASTNVGQFFRLRDGRLLLDQESADDPTPNYRLINEGLQSSFGLAGILPFGIRRIEMRNVDTSDGFSAEFVAVGSFGEVELRRETPFPERVARELIRNQLSPDCKFDGTDDPDQCVEIYFQGTDVLLDEEAGVNASLNRVADVRTVEDLQNAAAAILYASRFEEIVDDAGMRGLFERDDEPSQAFAEMFRPQEDAAQRIVDSAVAHANSIEDPTEQDFQFVLETMKFASTAFLLTLEVEPTQTIRDLTPAISKEVQRLQIDARSIDEINEGIDHSIIVATANQDDINGAAIQTIEGFIDAFVARVAVGDNDRTKLANTAISLAENLEFLTDENNSPNYRPDDVLERMRQHMSATFEFDPNNLLPQKPPAPLEPPVNDAVKVAILVGDLPLDAEGRLTTEGVTGLLENVPNGVTKLAPLESEFEFSFAIDNGSLVPLNIPNLTLAFDDLQLGKGFEAAGFLSLGSHGADGQFSQGTFAGGLDLQGDIGGFDGSLGVTIDGTSANRGFFPDEDGRGGDLVAQAIVDLNLTTPPDFPGFFLDVENAEATFDLLLHVDQGLIGGQYRVAATSISKGAITTNTRTTAGRSVLRVDRFGTRTVTREPQPVQTVTTSLLKSRLANGFVSDGQVHFDANGNGIADFLDVNGNGMRDNDELLEPIALTDAGGLFELAILPEFDQNGSGEIDPFDGLLVSTGGIDQGTGLSSPLRFKAPAGSVAVTPVTTVISALATEQEIQLQAAHDLLRDGLTVSGKHLRTTTDFFADDLISQINEGDASAILDYFALVQLDNIALLFGAGLQSDTIGLPDTGDHVFHAIAEELAAAGELEVSDSAALSRILVSASNRLGMTLNLDIAQAIVQVAIQANNAVAETNEATGLDLLVLVKQRQRFIQTEVTQALGAAVSGQLTPEQFVLLNVTGTITFAAGETEQVIRVPVHADSIDEVGEVFHVQLSDPTHALLATLRGVGTVQIPTNATVFPSEIQLGGPAIIRLGEELGVRVSLPGIVGGTVYWDDGQVDVAEITVNSDTVVASATHQYAQGGQYEITAYLQHGAGQTIIGRQTVTVRDPGDSNLDGWFNTADLVQVLQIGKYETDVPATWEEGDWDGNGYFGTSDLVLALQIGRYEVRALAANEENYGQQTQIAESTQCAPVCFDANQSMTMVEVGGNGEGQDSEETDTVLMLEGQSGEVAAALAISRHATIGEQTAAVDLIFQQGGENRNKRSRFKPAFVA